MCRKYRIVESIASSVSQYKSYSDQVYRYTLDVNQYFKSTGVSEKVSAL